MATDRPDIEDVALQSNKTSGFGLSLIWLVPLLAVVAALSVAWQNWSQKGPLIEVVFAEADGLEAGKTELRYRDIAVGLVEELRFSDDLASVIASIRLENDLAAFVDSDAMFWIVRPEVTAQGVSGLDTVLSGVYIAGAWDDEAGERNSQFAGLEAAPLIPLGETGIVFTLRSETELPPYGTPVLYKGVQVGRIGPAVLDDGGLTVSAPVAILAPHDQLITSATRFWDISGIDFSLGVGGAQLDFDSLASLIAGGVTFDTLGSGGTAVSEDAVFTLYPDEDAARDEFLVTSDGGTVDVVAIFDENLPGLQTGAAVMLGGLRLGQVTAISGVIDPDQFGDNQARLRAVLRLNPGRLNLDTSDGANGLISFLETRIGEGLRARLTTASILTGGLRVELVDIVAPPPAQLGETESGLPQIPTTPAELSDVAGSAQSVLARVESLPVEEILDEAIGLITDLRAVIGSDGVQAAPASLLATLNAVEKLTTSDEVAALPAQFAEVSQSLTDAAGRLNAMLGTFEEEAVATEIAALIDALEETAQTLPSLSAEARSTLQDVRALPLDDAVVKLTAALADVEALFADPNFAALPAELRGALQSFSTLLRDEALRALPADLAEVSDTAQASLQRIAELLDSVERSGVVEGVGETVAALNTAAADLPQLTEQAGRVLSQAEALKLDQLLAEVSGVVAAVTRVVEQDSTQALPDELNQTLAELRTAVAELRSGGLINNANATLAAARGAAEAISEASATLPALSERLTAAAAQASSTLADFDGHSAFGREFAAAISQVDAAAEALERLARQISRNPNSLITGR